MSDSNSENLWAAQQLIIKDQCAQLLFDFMAAVDNFDYERAISLFCEDCSLQVPNQNLEGLSALAQWLDVRPRDRKTRHVCSNIFFSQISTTTASSKALITLYAAATNNEEKPPIIQGPAAIVSLANEFSLTPLGWKIKTYAVSVEFSAG